MFGVKGDVFADKTGDEIVAVVVAFSQVELIRYAQFIRNFTENFWL